jgi:WD40 repeat protein
LDADPTGQNLASASDDGTVIEWQVQHDQRRECRFTFATMLKSVRYSPCGRFLAVAGWNGSIWLLDREGQLVWTKEHAHSSHIWRLCFAQNGDLIASGGHDGVVHIWSTLDGKSVSTFEGARSGVESLAFSPDGKMLNAVGFDGIRQWDVNGNALRWALATNRDHILDVAVAPNGEWIATCGTGRVLTIRDTDGIPLCSSTPERDNLVALSWGGKQGWIAAAGDQGEVVFWKIS